MRTSITTILLFLTIVALSQTVYSPQLTGYLINTDKVAEYVKINIFFDKQESLEDLSKHLDYVNADFDTRVKEVTGLLKRNSELSEAVFFQNLNERKINESIKNIDVYWGVNMISVEVEKSVIQVIAGFENVRYIDLDSPRYRIEDNGAPVIVSEKSIDGAEPGLKTINAHLLWELGYTGRNMLFLSVDTGVNPDHPAIEDNFAGNYLPMDQCWYGVRHDFPVDNASSSHGTHTTGTVLGVDRTTNDTIGVAFNSKWMATDPVASTESEILAPSDLLSVYQWAMNPDGDSETTNDVPRVINNSWGYDYEMALEFGACEMVEAEILVALETAGICSPFSAGNNGPGVSTTGFPAMRAFNLVNPMSVGALEQNGTQIATFSSRGPSLCVPEVGSLQIKPEVSAPGVNVRSCVGIDEYGELSGTSMACPHVAGALLLLAEAFPNVSAYDLKNSLYVTAIDLGDPGEDNVFGNGIIDVFAAYEYLALTYTPTPPVSNQYDIISEISTPTSTVVCPDDRTFVAEILISNAGTESISQVNLKMYLNDEIIVDSLLDITIASGSDYLFITDAYEFDFGRNELYSLVSTEAEYSEYDIFNNGDIKTYYVIKEDDFPYSTDFSEINDEFSNSNWLILNPDNKGGWQKLSWGLDEEYSAFGVDFRNYGSREFEEDYAVLPRILLPNQDDLFMSFSYAYKRRLEYFYKDSIIIEISTDCGLTFSDELWRSGGEDLATVEGNSGTNMFIPESWEEFDTIDISLSNYKNQEVIIRYRSVNDRGSVFYVDYIRIDDNVLNNLPVSNKLPKLNVYPNPAENYLIVEISNFDFEKNTIIFYNSSGQLVKEYNLIPEKNIITVNDLMPGIYFIRIKGSSMRSKLIVK